MRVMIVGGGGREHTLAWKMSGSPQVTEIVCVPGNGGMQQIGECVPCDVTDLQSLCDLASEKRIDLTVVGPEAPLVAGIVDRFMERGLRIFGPTKEAAMIEGSKSFAKDIMEKYGVPTGRATYFESFEEAKSHIERLEPPIVTKADGLAAGKGVVICGDRDEALEAARNAMIDKAFGESGERLLVEEYLDGPEVSILTLSDGTQTAHMVPSQDHKRAYDGDKGPNTGGMGAYSPVPLLDSEAESLIHREVMDTTIRSMSEEGIPYRGVLYGGLMLTDEGPKVLEFNVRFGDPEVQVVLPRLKTDILPGLVATLDGNLGDYEMEWSPEYCVCVVVASGGYPGRYRKGVPITGLKTASSDPMVEIFHAGTKAEDGRVVTDGGRVLDVVALGGDFEEARGLAYQAVEMISFEGMQYRTDIGYRALS